MTTGRTITTKRAITFKMHGDILPKGTYVVVSEHPVFGFTLRNRNRSGHNIVVPHKLVKA